MYIRGFTFCALLVLALNARSQDSPVRLNHIQVLGTHNSYHVEPARSVLALISENSPGLARSLTYTHRPLDEQLGRLGIRQLELDLYADPRGGMFTDPLASRRLEQQGVPQPPAHDQDGVLSHPGLKILHIPDIDYRTTVLTFNQALTILRTWSGAHPNHIPILVLLELKEDGIPGGVTPVPFDPTELDRVDSEILAVFQRENILTPDDVRGTADTLRQAVLTHGWPTLDSTRGKLMFALDNGGPLRDAYTRGHPSLTGRLMFASVPEEDQAAAWFKINDPVSAFDRIQRLVRAGFLVRTRADAGTRQARENDPTRRDRALASGAHFISTDYPAPNPDVSGYHVQFPQPAPARANPVTAPNLQLGPQEEAPE